MNPLKFNLSNESATVVYEGQSYTVREGSPHFKGLVKALIEKNWEDVPKHLTVAKSLKEWAKGKFMVDGTTVTFDGVPLPQKLNAKIISMATRGISPQPFLNFWERLQKNPSWRSVQQLFDFIAHENIPITKDGKFLAYKGVNGDYTDKHTSTVDNHPGKINKLPRNQISDDPNEACHFGYHVGALNYARTFARIVVICEIDPEHVVCVPHDASQQKMRVCQYEVIGNWNGQPLPSTVYVDDNEEELQSDPNDFDNNDDEGPDAEEFEEDEGDESEPKAPKQKKSKAPQTKKRPKSESMEVLANMDMKELLEQSIDILRKYAAGTLKIVGASKIPGGKSQLVSKIIEVRKNNS
jgi:hypothetical protein